MTKTFQFTKQQEEFITAEEDIVIFSGAVGAGKSRAICCDAYKEAITHPGSRILIARKEYSSLRKSTMQTWNQIIPKENIIDHNKSEHTIKVKTLNEDGQLTAENPSEIWYEGLDKGAGDDYPKKIGSTEFSKIYVDEGYELEQRTFEFLTTRLRHSAYNFRTGNKINHQIKTATNPDGPNHWMKKEYIDEAQNDPTIKVIEVSTTDNEFLDDDVLEMQLNRWPKDSMMYDRLIKGKWTAAEGMVYSSFDPAKHVVKRDEEMLENYSDYKRIVAGADSGWHPDPRVVITAGVRSNGRIDVLDEFYRTKATVDEAVAWLDNLDYKVSVIYHDPSEPEDINDYKKAGYNCRKATNDIVPGITQVTKHFANMDGKDIRIAEKCINTQEELLSYRYPKNQDKKNSDVPVDADNHAMDSLRYLCMGIKGGGTTIQQKQSPFAKKGNSRKRSL